MNRAPAFQFYPDKWQSHTRRLSDGAYRVFHELVCWMWQSSPDYCSIEASDEAVACAVAMPIECVRNANAEILNAFAPLLRCESGRWVCNGLRKEAEKQFNRRSKAKSSANARWNNANASESHANASSKQCSPSPSPSPSPCTQVQTEKGFHPLDPDVRFEKFWSIYPRKTGKGKALKLFKSVIKKVPVDTLISAVEQQTASEQWRKEGGQYIPHPATWLSQGRWDDVLTPSSSANGKPDILDKEFLKYKNMQ